MPVERMRRWPTPALEELRRQLGLTPAGGPGHGGRLRATGARAPAGDLPPLEWPSAAARRSTEALAALQRARAAGGRGPGRGAAAARAGRLGEIVRRAARQAPGQLPERAQQRLQERLARRCGVGQRRPSTPAAWPRRWRCWPIGWTSARSWPAWRPTSNACTSCWQGDGRGREGVGRTLDFLLQELGRELNTVGSEGPGRGGLGPGHRGQGRVGEDPRAGAEYRVMSGYFRRGILMVISSPVRGGQDHARPAGWPRPTSCTSRSRTPRARPAPGEVDGEDYHFVSNDDVRADGRGAGVRRTRGGARQPLRHGHRHRQQGHRAGHRLPVRHRLPGRPADPPAVARGQRAVLHPAARRWPSWSAGCAAGPPTRPR